MGATNTFLFYVILSAALFFFVSLISSYSLLNNAISSVSKSNAYYTYTRICETLSSSVKSSYSSASNLNLYPEYVIFSPYFKDSSEIYYDIMSGTRVFSYGITYDNKNTFETIVDSATSTHYSNEGDSSRAELEKCVNQTCICIGEMDTMIKYEPEYFVPMACADICWGEYPADYKNYINSIEAYDDLSVKEIISETNSYISSAYPDSQCAQCVNYMSSEEYSVISGDYYSVIATDFNSNLINKYNANSLNEFSKYTKYSFITNVIECKTMKELVSDAGKTYDSQNPFFFVFDNGTSKGVFSLMSSSDDMIFKVFSLEYISNSDSSKSYSITSFIKSQELGLDNIFGAE